MLTTISLTAASRQALHKSLDEAYRRGDSQVAKRIHALLLLGERMSVSHVALVLNMGEQTIRNALKDYLLNGPPVSKKVRRQGRPPKLSKTQRKELGYLIDQGPQSCGYETACWSGPLISELIQNRFGVKYHPRYVCQLLKEMGFSYQKGRFASDHLNEVARLKWKTETWPKIVALAKEKKAPIFFGDEASFAQWGSLFYTWARRNEQPTVRTSGKRKGYKVFGLIDVISGEFLYKGQEDRFNSESYLCFLEEVLEITEGHIILVQDGARYHTSSVMKKFFALHADRLSVFQLPSYSPDFNPIEFLWKKVKKQATHLKYFAQFEHLVDSVETALLHFAEMPSEITSLVGQYCESLAEFALAA